MFVFFRAFIRTSYSSYVQDLSSSDERLSCSRPRADRDGYRHNRGCCDHHSRCPSFNLVEIFIPHSMVRNMRPSEYRRKIREVTKRSPGRHAVVCIYLPSHPQIQRLVDSHRLLRCTPRRAAQIKNKQTGRRYVIL